MKPPKLTEYLSERGNRHPLRDAPRSLDELGEDGLAQEAVVAEGEAPGVPADEDPPAER